MATARKSTALERLIPKRIEVKTDSGVIIVAGNAEENKILNYLLAAQIRDVMKNTIQKLKDQEVMLTPKELKELADAGKSLAEFSATVYKDEADLNPPGEKPAEKVAAEVDSAFDVLTPKPEEKK